MNEQDEKQIHDKAVDVLQNTINAIVVNSVGEGEIHTKDIKALVIDNLNLNIKTLLLRITELKAQKSRMEFVERYRLRGLNRWIVSGGFKKSESNIDNVISHMNNNVTYFERAIELMNEIYFD